MTIALHNNHLPASKINLSTEVQEVLLLLIEKNDISKDLQNTYEWAICDFIKFIVQNGFEPTIAKCTSSSCMNWLNFMLEEDYYEETVFMKIIVITSFFTQLQQLGVITYNPFLGCYEYMNLFLTTS